MVEEVIGQWQVRPTTQRVTETVSYPIRGTCVETCEKRQPLERLLRVVGFRNPSTSVGGLSMDPPQSTKNADTRVMVARRVCLSALSVPPRYN